MIVVAFVFFLSGASLAQQKKGDVEITAFSSGFTFSFGGDFKPTSLSGSGVFFTSQKFQSFALGGEAGYFLTRKNKIGGGLAVSAIHFSSCTTTFDDGEITGETCGSDGSAHLGVTAFYR